MNGEGVEGAGVSAAISLEWSNKALSCSAFKGQSLITRPKKPTLASGTEADERLNDPISLAPKAILDSRTGQAGPRPRGARGALPANSKFHRADIEFEAIARLSNPIVTSTITSLTSSADRLDAWLTICSERQCLSASTAIKAALAPRKQLNDWETFQTPHFGDVTQSIYRASDPLRQSSSVYKACRRCLRGPDSSNVIIFSQLKVNHFTHLLSSLVCAFPMLGRDNEAGRCASQIVTIRFMTKRQTGPDRLYNV